MSPISSLFRGVYEALHETTDTLNQVVFTSSAMAGTGSGARSWSAAYDPIASTTLHTVCELTTGYGVMAAMLDHTWHLYATADCAAFQPRPLFTSTAPPTRPQLPPLELLHVASAPTAYGIGRQFDLPWPLSLLTDVLRMVHWPTTDVDRMRQVAGAWRQTAEALLVTMPAAAQATATLGAYQAPGLPRAVQAAARMQAAVLAAGHACQALASACDAYAAKAEGLYDVLRAMVEALEEIIGTGLLFAGITGGVGALLDGAGGGSVVITRVGAMVAEIVGVDTQVAELGAATAATTAGLALTMKDIPNLSNIRLPALDVYDGIAKMASQPDLEGLGGDGPRPASGPPDVVNPGETGPTPVREWPEASDQKLRNVITNLFRGTENPTRVGDGTAMDAYRFERATGTLVKGRDHGLKLGYELRALTNWLRKNPHASRSDVEIATQLLNEIKELLER